MIDHISQPDGEKEIFESLNPIVRNWFKKKFEKFSDAQRYSLIPIRNRKNILISSPTGSGKTLSAFASILNYLIELSERGELENKVYAIYASPLKALNQDIAHNLLTPLQELEKTADKKLGIRVGVRTGDTTAYEKAKMAKNPPHILITTPESLAIILNSPKFKENLTKTQWLIVDEIHSLAENKRGVHLSLTIERLERLSPGITRIGLSATIAPLEDVARFLVGYSGEEERDCGIVDVRFLKEMDLKRVKKSMRRPVIVDGRNIYDPRVVRKLGFKYMGIGR